jgi:hypothetical protein
MVWVSDRHQARGGTHRRPRTGDFEVSDDPTALSHRLASALLAGDEALRELHVTEPATRRDRFLVLSQIYDLHRAPLHRVGDRARWQHHPAVCSLKGRLEHDWLAELERHPVPAVAPERTGEEMQAIAARNRAPAAYGWIAEQAPWELALRFLALEGGPDDLFDDLVATCQVGLPLGPAKMELAGNYWDEMGNGRFGEVHNVLYRQFVEAVDLPEVPRDEQPVEALERAALLGLLATNRWLQPELIGALGLIELEAGPQCRYVERGLHRLRAPEGAHDFYAMHAAVDPLHGKGWVENAVAPLVTEVPEWAPRILRGAVWKSVVNEGFFGWAERALMPAARPAPA